METRSSLTLEPLCPDLCCDVSQKKTPKRLLQWRAEKAKQDLLSEEPRLSSKQEDYDRLIQPIEEQMIRSVSRIVENPDDVADAFQEALATIWKKRTRIRRHPNPHALILRICINAAYDAIRRRVRERQVEQLKAIPDSLPDASSSPRDVLASKELKGEVVEAIDRLPRNQAVAVSMRFLQNQSFGDIAHALGCSEAGARKSVSRGCARLRELLAHLGPDGTKEVAQ
jgi:RNA polymerase sigma factor (sigma-70 family)